MYDYSIVHDPRSWKHKVLSDYTEDVLPYLNMVDVKDIKAFEGTTWNKTTKEQSERAFIKSKKQPTILDEKKPWE